MALADWLDEIESANHEHLLASGNLNKPKVVAPWTGKPWISQGYLARVTAQSCECGNDMENLIGIFHIETRKREDGAEDRRELSLDLRSQISLSGENPVEVTYLTSVKACPACISQKGFAHYRAGD